MPWNEEVFEHKPVAVLDIGSHSVRLVLYDGLKRIPVSFFNEKVLCGLGRGLALSGNLDGKGMARALVALRRFHGICAQIGLERCFAVATAAVREAQDGLGFLERAQEAFGHPIRLLSAEEEAYFSAMGVIAGMGHVEGVVGDLGGGSLELVHVEGDRVGERSSLPLGPLRLQDVSGGSFKKATALIDDALRSSSVLPHMDGKNFYAVGGAFRGLARFQMKEADYPLRVLQNYTLAKGSARIIAQTISGLSPSFLREKLEISKSRSETLPFGALVLERILSCTKVKNVVISAGGMREGLLFDALSHHEQKKDPLLLACGELSRSQGRSALHAQDLVAWTSQLSRAGFFLETKGEARLRACACLLSDVGWHVHPDYGGQWSAAMLSQASFLGLDHFDRAFLAACLFLRYDGPLSDGLDQSLMPLLTDASLKRARILAAALRLAFLLTGSAPGVLKDIAIFKAPDGGLVLRSLRLGDLMGEAPEKALARLGRLLQCPVSWDMGG